MVPRTNSAPNLEEPLLALRLHEGVDETPARILAARDGDRAARAWLVQRWSAPVYRFCYRMLGNEQDARDCAQDALVKVLQEQSP